MDNLKAFESRALQSPFSEDDFPSTFTETMEAAYALTRREEISASAGVNWGRKVDERAQVIGKLGGNLQRARDYDFIPPGLARLWREAERDGRLPEDPTWRAASPEQRVAYEHVREFEQRFPEKVLDDQALLDQIKPELASMREEDQDVLTRGGGFAAFVGSAGAVMTDPAVLLTAPLGGGAGAGRTVLGTVGRVAGTEGAIALATEIPIQAAVYNYKRQIESPWSWRDSAINVLAAGVGGAVLGGTIAGGVEGTRLALRSYRERVAAGQVQPTPETEAAAAVLEDSLTVQEQNPLGGSDFAESVHEEALELAREQVANGQPVDVADTVGFIEPPDPVGQVITRSQDPAALLSIDPLELQVDARTFQFKAGGDAEGVTGALRDVERFDRRLAGVALVWERADGQRFIVDGHQRVGLARRAIAAGQDPAEVQLNGFLLREADGVTAQDARRIAAIKNMAEGSGSAIDAAKILRDLGPAGEAALPPLPPRSALVRQARGLAALDEEAFLQVVNGVIDERFGAIVGQATAEPKLQQAMIQVLKRAQPANEVQARSIVDQVKAQGVEVRTTEDLFGEASFAESLYLERAQVLDQALKLMRQDRNVFGGLVANQDRIAAGAANVLDTAGNLARAQEAADVATQISIRANAKGSLSDALTAAARRLGEGASAAAAARDFLAAARREILQGDSGRGAAGKAGRSSKAGGQVSPRVGRPVRLQDLPAAEQPAALQAFKARQQGQSLEELYQVAEGHQSALAGAGQEIAEALGDDVRLVDPGVKSRAGSEEKIQRKGYSDASQLTDVVRIGFITRTPEQADQVLSRLAQRFELLDEGVGNTSLGYVDRKALVRFPDGRVGELQLWGPEIAGVKFGRGHEIYEINRRMTAAEAATPEGRMLREQLEEESRQLYAEALARESPEWRRLGMQGLPEDMRQRVIQALEAGAPPPVSRTPVGSAEAVKADTPPAAFIVYRIGNEAEELQQRNAGTLQGVAEFSEEADEKLLGTGKTLTAYLVEPEPGTRWGPFEQMQAGRETAAEKKARKRGVVLEPRIGRSKRGWLSFPKGGFAARPLGSMPLAKAKELKFDQSAVDAALGVDSLAAGSGGASGNISRKAAREISEPDSSTSTGTTRRQTSSPGLQTKASSPPPGLSRSTAGRPSQLKNRSAIDAPPRGIIQRTDDPRSAQPEPSRTGTVSDADYEAVMTSFRGLQEDLGAQLKVTQVVDGELVERQAAAVIDELDTLEESLERIRVCAIPAA